MTPTPRTPERGMETVVRDAGPIWAAISEAIDGRDDALRGVCAAVFGAFGLATPAPAASAPDQVAVLQEALEYSRRDTSNALAAYSQLLATRSPRNETAASAPAGEDRGEVMRSALINAMCDAFGTHDWSEEMEQLLASLAQRGFSVTPALPARDEARPDAGTGVGS